jgi:hypothetical protein
MVRRLIILFALIAVIVPAVSQDRARDDKPDVAGKLNYDKEKKQLVVTPARGEPVKLTVDKGTEIIIDGKRGVITTIPDNHPVRVYLGPGGKVVRRLFAEGPTQQRKVLAVIEERRSLQLEREKDTELVSVAPDAVIVVNGRDAKISDVQPGDMATLRFLIDGRTVIGIQVGLGKPVEGKIPVKN